MKKKNDMELAADGEVHSAAAADEGSTVSKFFRKAKDSNSNPDRLSDLPEYLIVQILSLLPTKEAVRTGVLSTRWKNLWNYIDKIVLTFGIAKRPFERPNLSSEQVENFISFVDHTLMKCVCLKTFSLHAQIYEEHQFVHELLDKWLLWFYSHKVENLKIRIPGITPYAPPGWFYNNSSLVNLCVNNWNFTTLGPVVSWTLLKSLCLFSMVIDDEQIAKILSGCPSLEDLDLRNVQFKRLNINISSPRLVKLRVIYSPFNHLDGTYYRGEGLLEINAPWLQYLNLSKYFNRVFVRLINVSSLIHANFNFYNPVELKPDELNLDEPSKVLEKVQHVEELTLGHLFIMVLSEMKLLGKISGPLFFKCKQLTFVLPIFKFELPGIAYILQSSGHIETLVINVRKYDWLWNSEDLDEMCNFDVTSYLSMEIEDFPHLKSIEVSYDKGFFEPYCNCDPYPPPREYEYFVLELVAYIMGKAPVLEKLVIAPKEFCKSPKNCAWEEASVLHHKLLQFFTNREGVCSLKSRMMNNSYFKITPALPKLACSARN